MDDNYQRAEQENLRNPKNRFLGLFCHANEVDNKWGCDWSFATGVVIFSLICGIVALVDIYYISYEKIYSFGSTMFRIFFSLKMISNVACLLGIVLACISISRSSYRSSIASYYTMVLAFLLHTVFLFASIIYLFYPDYVRYIGLRLIGWGFAEFGYLLFCWILFCNQVYMRRQIMLLQNSQ